MTFRAAVGSSVVGALMAFAATTTFVFTIDLVPVRLANFLQGLTNSPSVFLFLMMLILVVAGMFIESIAAYIMLVPIFAPIAAAYGIDISRGPLHPLTGRTARGPPRPRAPPSMSAGPFLGRTRAIPARRLRSKESNSLLQDLAAIHGASPHLSRTFPTAP